MKHTRMSEGMTSIAEPLKECFARTPEPLPEHLFMYCPSCGWMNSEEGVGKSECPVCVSVAHWVKGTTEELREFRAAIAEDPGTWKSFRCTDYWIGSPDEDRSNGGL